MTRSTRPLQLAILIATLSLAAACTPASGTLGTPATPPPTSAPSLEPPSPEPTPDAGTPSPSLSPTPSGPGSPAPSPTPPRPTPSPSPQPGETTILRAYFVLGSFTGNEGLVPVLREVPRTVAVGTAAMKQLLAGPTSKEMAARPAMFTAIPDGTRLLGLRIDNRVATVDLSREFESGGGSASVFARLAQVVYTLTQFPTVDSVRFQLDGEPVTIFSGEGVILDKPVGRDDYYEQLPAIFVDRPAWGAALGNAGRVSGLANVFEATLQVRLLSATGRVLAQETVMASCGTGCWGDWATTLRYDVARAQWGTLRVYDLSARDGSEENVTEYPVWLTPAG